MVKSPVKVCVRTRPTDSFASQIEVGSDKKTISINVKPNEKFGVVNNAQQNWSFKFDNVLNNASQEAVYDDCASDIVQSVLEGYNGTIMAYGQTGAGKTYTTMGGSSYKYRGIAPRAVAHIFHHIHAHSEAAFTVRVSYVEIYNEGLQDLLSSTMPSAEQSELTINEDGKGNVLIKGLSKPIANNEEEALNFLFEGDTNRAIGEHQLNKSSTRSHCVFTIHIEMRSRVDATEKIVLSKLNLVDLAGSERIKKTGSEGTILKEANYINKSLTFLEQVVIALSEKGRDHVPYRQSKLTSILRDSLGGNCKTLMIANVWVEAQHLEETTATLKFASRMMRVKNEALINEQQDPSMLVKRYEREIRELKQELAMHDSLANRTTITYDPFTEEQQHEMNQTVRKYLGGELDEIEIQSLRQVREAFKQFRVILKAREGELQDRLRSVSQAQNLSNDASSGAAPARRAQNHDDEGVGEVETAGGFGIGMAPANARPAAARGSPVGLGGMLSKQQATLHSSTTSLPPNRIDAKTGIVVDPAAAASNEGATPKAPPPDKNSAYEEYKRDVGAEYNAAYDENKAALKEKRRIVKELSVRINEAKREIDALRDRVNVKKLEQQDAEVGEDGEQVIDEEEYSLIKQMRELKQRYQEDFEQYKTAKHDVDYIVRLQEQCKEKLLMEFQQWYEKTYAALGNQDDTAAQASTLGATKISIEEEQMDEGELFDKLELERMSPESTAFYNAKKHTTTKLKQAGRKGSPVKRPR
mmetsp:Transcript_42830/g.69440  ORF Transcript_42830/g.69440 Transcript_42830/m.69440 type:complete len:756 (-) Transcript_42830:1307-3574(-)